MTWYCVIRSLLCVGIVVSIINLIRSRKELKRLEAKREELAELLEANHKKMYELLLRRNSSK